MYVKNERPLDTYLAAAALLPFDENLQPLESATQKEIDDFNILFNAALMRPDETERPPIDWFKSGGNESDHAKLRYELFLIIRGCLGAITKAVAGERPEGRNLSKEMPVYEMPEIPALRKRWITLSGSGVDVYNDPQQVFLDCLKGTGEELWNLRACPVCGVPFLPRREDQKACTLKCSNVFRLRNHRAAKMKKQKRAVRPNQRKGANR